MELWMIANILIFGMHTMELLYRHVRNTQYLCMILLQWCNFTFIPSYVWTGWNTMPLYDSENFVRQELTIMFSCYTFSNINLKLIIITIWMIY